MSKGSRQKVVIGFLGSQLDSGGGAGRWEKWRPTVSLAQHEDMAVARLELLHSPDHLDLARRVVADIHAVSPETTCNLVPIALKDAWDFGEVYGALYDWLRTYEFDSEREEYWAHITTGTHVAQICLFLMVEARFIPGVLLQTAPPKRQARGNAGSYALIDLDLARYDALAKRFAVEHTDAVSFLKSGIATRNAKFNALIDEIERVAVRSKAPILITGPTGAGKSYLARRMFELKKSRHLVTGEFVDVNCATLRGDSSASALFGHRKGSFTGAVTDRAGLLKTAHRGVLFLDEIGELGADEQAMLLKAIEEKRFLPVGSDRDVESDFQLIAGTNHDLRDAVATGSFREDLFARINLWSYELPGLANRREDIGPNVEHLLTVLGQDMGRRVRFTVEAQARFMAFAESSEAVWAGNFRDLSASVTRLATLAEAGRIGIELVDAEIARLRWLWSRHYTQSATAGGAIELSSLLSSEALCTIDRFDQLQLCAVIAECRGARTMAEAGRRLFDASRKERSVVNDSDRVRKYLLRFGLSWDRVVA
jgi:transcriptional regulatory protein RtcR